MERFFDFEIYILYILAKQVNPLSANPPKTVIHTQTIRWLLKHSECFKV